MRVVVGVLLLGVALVLLAGCGEEASTGAQENKAEAADMKATEACLARTGRYPQVDPTQPSARKGSKLVTLTLEGLPDAEDAGLLLAYHRGYFAEVGVDIDLHSPVVSRNVPGYLDQGVIDLGLIPQPQVAMSKAHGMPLTAVGSVVGSPVTAMMWLPESSIGGVADFAGKTIAINGLPWEEAVLEALLTEEDLSLDDITLRRPGYGLVSALLDGSADAILGVTENVEGVELEACGVEPVVTPLRKLGVPPYEEVQVVARDGQLAHDAWWIKAFMSALARGNAAAAKDTRAAAEAIAAARLELNIVDPQVPALTEAKVKATFPLLSKSGQVDQAQTARLADWMRREGLLRHEVAPE